MFDVGFSELVVCFLVALIVLGPQKLATLARTLGLWAGRAKGYVATVTAQLERESEAARELRQLKDSARAVQDQAASAARELRGAVTRPSAPPPKAPRQP